MITLSVATEALDARLKDPAFTQAIANGIKEGHELGVNQIIQGLGARDSGYEVWRNQMDRVAERLRPLGFTLETVKSQPRICDASGEYYVVKHGTVEGHTAKFRSELGQTTTKSCREAAYQYSFPCLELTESLDERMFVIVVDSLRSVGGVAVVHRIWIAHLSDLNPLGNECNCDHVIQIDCNDAWVLEETPKSIADEFVPEVIIEEIITG